MAPPQETISIGSAMSSGSEREPMLVLSNCPAKASNIELQFQSMTDKEFMIRIEAPNGEQSQLLRFMCAGKTQRFTPVKTGCGHGNWEIDVFRLDKDGNCHHVLTEELLADGKGSLFFTVGDNLQPALVSQVWSHLHKNASCRKYSFFGGEK